MCEETLGICICNNVFEPTSTLKVSPTFSKVPPLFLCQTASGDNILASPSFIPPLFPVSAPILAAILNPPLSTCDAPAVVERARQAALGVVDVAVRRRPRACIVPQFGQTVKGIVGVMHRAAHSAAGHDRSPLQVLFGLGDDYHSCQSHVSTCGMCS